MKKKFLRKLHKNRTIAVKKSKFLFKHPLLLPVSTFIVLFFVGLIGFVAIGGSTQGARDARIVNVYVDGEQQTVTTRAQSIGDLVERLDISLVEEDIVEPSLEEPILEDDTQVNIYRARPVEITDNGRILTVVSAQRTPRLIAADADIELFPEDKVLIDNTQVDLLKTGVRERLVIKRSVEVKLNVYGVLKLVRTTADTVSGLLAEEGVSPNEGEIVQPSIDAEIIEDGLVAVNLPGVETVTVEESIDFAVDVEDDDTLVAGQSNVRSAGQTGLKVVIYEVKKNDDGKEIERSEIQTVVLKKPVTEVRVRGTKIVTPSFNPSVTVAGDKAALMAAAGIAPGDYGFVDYIISKESGWRPGAINSSSGAYGLCQSLPASKMASAGADYRTNPVTQLRWCSGYANGRYGGWAGSYNAWLAQNWW